MRSNNCSSWWCCCGARVIWAAYAPKRCICAIGERRRVDGLNYDWMCWTISFYLFSSLFLFLRFISSIWLCPFSWLRSAWFAYLSDINFYLIYRSFFFPHTHPDLQSELSPGLFEHSINAASTLSTIRLRIIFPPSSFPSTHTQPQDFHTFPRYSTVHLIWISHQCWHFFLISLSFILQSPSLHWRTAFVKVHNAIVFVYFID